MYLTKETSQLHSDLN